MVLTLKGTSDIILPMLMPVSIAGYFKQGWYVKQLYLMSTPDNDKPLRKDDDTITGSFSNTSLTYDTNNSAVLGHADFKTQNLAPSANTLRQVNFLWSRYLDDGVSPTSTDEPTFRVKINDFDMNTSANKVLIVNINVRRK